MIIVTVRYPEVNLLYKEIYKFSDDYFKISKCDIICIGRYDVIK